MRKFTAFVRGLAALMACLFVLATIGTELAESYRSQIDGALGTESYVIQSAEDAVYKSDYDTIEEMMAAAKDLAIREGEEGTVVMKNDNAVLPLQAGKSVALFGLAAYAPYSFASGDLKAGNDDDIDLVEAFALAGVTVNADIQSLYMDKLLNKHEEQQTVWGQVRTVVAYDNMYVTAPGDMTTYRVVEIDPARFIEKGVEPGWAASIDKDSTVGIVVFARGAGEGNTYMPGSALDYDGNPTGEDPLKLSAEELAVVDCAKELCSQVVVLINSANNLMIGDIAKGGEHEVDGIVYIGVLNDYQAMGVVNVLTGQVNATGALPDTYVYDNASIPAVVNFGGDYYGDYEIVGVEGTDPRWPGETITNGEISSFGGGASYNGGTYIVEAEGIYVGYKYFETRYYDAIANPGSNAASAKGATQTADGWNYDAEVVYSFGHGLSYIPYSQTIKSVTVDKTENGNVTAVVTVTNMGDKDGKFLAQLYVQQPYTDYDKANLVEKSAVMYLNSKKVGVPAGQSVDVEITVPAKYLASYDYTAAKTYILDEGDYYFTAAAGAHEAVNNILAAQGYAVDAAGPSVTWNLAAFDGTTFATQNGTKVTNVADMVDMNYWLPGSVTYLSRQDWDGTYPINYNEVTLNLSDSPKKDEWIALLRGEVYTIVADNPAKEAVDNGLRFDRSTIGAAQIASPDDEVWDKLVAEITIDEAVGAVIHGGSRSDVLTTVDNPIVIQNEGVAGFASNTYTDEATGKTYHANVHSQTLIASSFNPDLAYEWGLIEGNTGLWFQRYHLWGTGLTQRRTPYNGRNYEYISEDAMLTNRIGYGILQGCADKGIINGPKHMGFNDQEHNRAGISVYMTEQKFRETDLRGFEGGLCDAKGLGVMIAFNRLGPVNASMASFLLQDILRHEWDFNGLISTDMATNKYYFNAESMVMAGITQVADFGQNDNHINQGEGGVDKTWPYLSVDVASKDAALVEAARENLKYQLWTYANSAILDHTTVRVATWWDSALALIRTISFYAMIGLGVLWLLLALLTGSKAGRGRMGKFVLIITILAMIATAVAVFLYMSNLAAEGGRYYDKAVTTLSITALSLPALTVDIVGIAAAAVLLLAIIIAAAAPAKSRAANVIVGLLQICAPVLLTFIVIALGAARGEDLAFLFLSTEEARAGFSAADIASGNTELISVILFAVSMLLSIIAAFFNLKKDSDEYDD